MLVDIYSSCPALDPAQFKQDMKALQAKGKVFVLSLGGAEGTITLNTDQDEANFVSSLTALIKEWGFDGLDVDLESGSNLVHGSQIQARLGRALKQIEKTSVVICSSLWRLNTLMCKVVWLPTVEFGALTFR